MYHALPLITTCIRKSSSIQCFQNVAKIKKKLNSTQDFKNVNPF